MIRVNISNRVFYTVLVIVAVLTVSIAVYAFGGSNPSVMGHSAGEIQVTDPTTSALADLQTALNNMYGGGSLEVLVINGSGDYDNGDELFCPAGYVRTGCGVGHQQAQDSRIYHGIIPIEPHGCKSYAQRPVTPMYAICMRIN